MLFGSRRRHKTGRGVSHTSGPAGNDAGKRQSQQWDSWRYAAQKVTRAWNEWLAADRRERSELEASGAGEPEGRLFHAAYGDDEVHMFEVWESPEQFEAHRKQMLARLQGSTLGSATVEIHELHSPRPD